MAGNHETQCPGCTHRTLWVHQTESHDVRYCERCGYGDEIVLARPRAVVPPETSARDRSTRRPRENEVRRLKR